MQENLLKDFIFPDAKKHRLNENEFIDDMINGCNKVRQLMMISTAIIPDPKLTKLEQGILMGHMVRLFKLYDTFVFLLADNRIESCILFTRLITDTLFNLLLLIINGEIELFNKFIRASLAYDKKLLEEINKRKKDPLLPIEERMINSIKNAFKDEGYEVGDIKVKDKEWQSSNTFELADKLKLLPLYEFVYRTTSQSIHGSWTEMKTYHLELDGDQYKPNIDFHSPRPQLISTTTRLALEGTKAYLHKIYIYDSENLPVIVQCINLIIDWFNEIDLEHELFINKDP